jgi:nucleoside-diphosphate-sugar epimerase
LPPLLLTGATGFVGTSLARRLSARGEIVRNATARLGGRQPADWSVDLQDCRCVVHLAARVHVMREPSSDPLESFRAVNTAGTLELARQAVAAGVKRFVFVSSVKVNGESTLAGRPFRHDDPPRPLEPYGVSKREAEDGLRDIARTSGLEVVIVRPPLVYGPGAKANFAAMARAVRRGLPLPLGSVTHNQRSLVALDNLVDLLHTCIDHPAAAHQTFLVSDDEDLSTAELLRRLGRAMGRPARLWPLPPQLIRTGAALLALSDVAERLLGNLQVDISHTRHTLGWAPPLTVDEGLRRAVAEPGQ